MKNSLLTLSEDEGLARLEQAIRHCSKGWIPVQSSIYARFKERLRAREYTNKHDLFVSDLKADASLFFYIASRIPSFFPSLSEEVKVITLSENDTEEILLMLPPRAEDLSLHSFSNASKLQVTRLRHGIVSTSTAELIAEKQGLDTLGTFSCSSLRQLGLSLIAFNYPSLYRRACEEGKDRLVSVPLELEKLLGFSPEKLAACLCLKWGMKDEIAESVLATSLGRLPLISEHLPLIAKFSAVGESFARLSDPETYPHAFEEGSWVKEEFTKYLGPESIALVQNRVAENFTRQGLGPDCIKAMQGTLDEIIERGHLAYTVQSMKGNAALSECGGSTIELFKSVYSLMRPSALSVEATNQLVTQILPKIGFVRGCIYLVEEKSQTAIPKLKFLAEDASRYPVVPLTQGTELAHLLASARTAPTPLRGKRVFLYSTQPISHITWKLGDMRNLGILHLEIDEEFTDRSSRDLFTLFEVVRKALLSCVGLSGT